MDFNSGSISGGTLLASGSSGMLQTLSSDSTQVSLTYSLSSTYQAGTQISLTDSSGTVLAGWTAEKTFSSVTISTSDMAVGESYTLTVGSDSQTIEISSVSTSNAGGMNSNRP